MIQKDLATTINEKQDSTFSTKSINISCSDNNADINDVLARMRNSESTTYRRPWDKLVEPFCGLWRQQMVEWMYILVKHCNLQHEAAAGGSYFLDTAVAKGLVQTGEEYQLTTMAAFYLALKVYDSPSTRIIKLSSLVKLGHGCFTEQDIIQKEREMLRAMAWRLSFPTPNCFLHHYLRLLPGLDELTKCRLEEKSERYIELCTAREVFGASRSSDVAFAALLMALDEVTEVQETIPRVLLAKGAVALNTWQIQSFLFNMTTIAKVSHSSGMIGQIVSILDRSISTRRNKHSNNCKPPVNARPKPLQFCSFQQKKPRLSIVELLPAHFGGTLSPNFVALH